MIRPRLTADRLAPLLLVALLLAAFSMLAWLSLATYQGFNLHSFDLGNMSQAIWSAGRGEPLIFTSEGFAWSRLALHVELIYLLLAPLYQLWPSPVLLLRLQAALYALGSVPIYRLARRRLTSPAAALALAAIYLLFPVAQTAVLFEFHGDTLAMPLLLFALDALDRHAWRSYAFWLALALSCKFYVAVPVAVLGAILWLQGERRVGVATMLTAALWGVAAFVGLRSLFAPPDVVDSTGTAGGYLRFYFGQLLSVSQTLPARLGHGLVVFAPVLPLTWRAPRWLLPAAAVALPVMLSSDPIYDYHYHHYALAVPFLLVAAIYGAAGLQTAGASWSRWLALTAGLVLLFNITCVNTPLSPLFYLPEPGSGRGLDESAYGLTARDAMKEAWLQRYVPPQVPLAADDNLGVRLVNRPVLYRTRPTFRPFRHILPRVDYVALDGLQDFVRVLGRGYVLGGVRDGHNTIRQVMAHPGFRLLHARDGLLLFGREGRGLAQTLESEGTAAGTTLQATFAGRIGLIDATITPLGDRHYRLTYRWQALRPPVRVPLFAVTRLEGVEHARLLHLPSLGIRPVTQWRAGEMIRESFEVVLPEEIPPGTYRLWVGWYQTRHPFAAETDERSRVGAEYSPGTLTIK